MAADTRPDQANPDIETEGTASAVLTPLLQGVSIVIDTPEAGSDVPGNGTFLTEGFATGSGVVTTRARVNDSGTITNGTPVQATAHLPPYDWAYSFTGIRTNVFVSLTVEGKDSTGAGNSQTIQIRCVP
jgi:hypothetical protein